VLELPEPGPLRPRGADGLTFYEVEDASAVSCAHGARLRVREDAGRTPPDVLVVLR
jgi:hypothetical protein